MSEPAHGDTSSDPPARSQLEALDVHIHDEARQRLTHSSHTLAGLSTSVCSAH